MKRWPVSVAILVLATAPAGTQPREAPAKKALQARLDPALPRYVPSASVAGTIRSAGEDTMETLIKLWAEAFVKVHPDVQFVIEAKGGTTAGPALIQGTADIGLLGRNLMPDDVAPFEQKYGYRPFGVRVGGGTYQHPDKIKPTAIIVNKANPIQRLSLGQLDAIFSKTRKRGYKQDITTWGQLGLEGEWANRRINMYGIKSRGDIPFVGGNTAFLQERVLEGGALKDEVKRYETVGPVRSFIREAEAVARDPAGIGYVGFGFASNVKSLALAEKEGGPYYEGTFEEIASHRYPLSRFVYVFLNRAPRKPIDPKVKEFLRFILSKEGQGTLQKEGDFLPLPAAIVKQELAKLD